MIPITIEKFVQMYMKSNKGENKDLFTEELKACVTDKKNGVKCIQCKKPIWAIGSAISGSHLCFKCTTGETDDSEDYEIDTVCKR